MATVSTFPPDPATMAAAPPIPTRFTPGVVIAIDGPQRLGPESAGALTLLHVTFADNDSAQRGYREFGAIKPNFCGLPGFIRWLTFNDGVDTYTLGLWRSVDDVTNFVRSDAHRRVVEEQMTNPFEYSQFAGVWALHTMTPRTISCDNCQTRNQAPATSCVACGNTLDDTFLREP
jgi:heme-degrading monooxygenase HmoA